VAREVNNACGKGLEMTVHIRASKLDKKLSYRRDSARWWSLHWI